MRILVGSTNPKKIEAAMDAFEHYFPGCTVQGIEAASGVSIQPKSIPEIVEGARNRAKAAFIGCDYSVGIESGIIPIPGTLTGYMDTVCCIIWNGKIAGMGFGPSFEFPPSVIKRLLSEDTEAGVIFSELANKQNIKHQEGAIGFLSKGFYVRKEMMRTAVIAALFPIINKELYS